MLMAKKEELDGDVGLEHGPKYNGHWKMKSIFHRCSVVEYFGNEGKILEIFRQSM